MDPLRQMISDLQFKLRLKEERIEALESGEAYVRMEKRHQEEISYLDQRIKKLEQALAESIRQNTLNRKHWEQVFDDMTAEHAKEMAAKEKIIENIIFRFCFDFYKAVLLLGCSKLLFCCFFSPELATPRAHARAADPILLAPIFLQLPTGITLSNQCSPVFFSYIVNLLFHVHK